MCGEYQEGSGQNSHLDEDCIEGGCSEVDWVRSELFLFISANAAHANPVCLQFFHRSMQLKRTLELPAGVVLGYQVHSDAMKSRSTSGAKHRYEV